MAEQPYFKSDDPADVPPKPKSSVPWILLLLGLAVCALLLGMLWSRGRERYGAQHPSVGKMPARWQLKPLTGDPPALDLARMQGKVTVVNFWGTWCPPCQVELPHVVKLYDDLRGEEDFQLAAVSCEPSVEKDIDALRKTTDEFLEAQKFALPTYYDPQAISRLALMETTGENLAFPATVIFGRDGKLRGYWRGYRPGMETEIEALTRKLLAEKH
jgi:cytochrome c biogenesis protein CcmG/thiol:disulfide interchange protein DsbE